MTKKRLEAIVGKKNVADDEATLEAYSRDGVRLLGEAVQAAGEQVS